MMNLPQSESTARKQQPPPAGRVLLLAAAALLLASLACELPAIGGPTTDSNAVASIVAATRQALESATPPPPNAGATPSPTRPPLLGTVNGQVCYPSEGIPPMTLYFQNTSTQDLTTIEHDDGASSYRVDLPPGSYIAYAWAHDLQIGGSYSQMVTCGLTAECTNHTLITFNVTAGGATNGIDICDWYGAPGDVPTPSGQVVAGPSPTAPPEGLSLNCDGTYQRYRLIDEGASGKTVAVDRWDGVAWVNVWSLSAGDPNLRQILDEAGLYTFGGCQQLLVVPIRSSGPHIWLEVEVYAWDGNSMSQVYQNDGYYGQWSKEGAEISFNGATSLGGSPLTACDDLTQVHAWDGSAFVQTSSSIQPVPGCTPVVTAEP